MGRVNDSRIRMGESWSGLDARQGHDDLSSRPGCPRLVLPLGGDLVIVFSGRSKEGNPLERWVERQWPNLDPKRPAWHDTPNDPGRHGADPNGGSSYDHNGGTAGNDHGYYGCDGVRGVEAR